jgi:hypothetical protein
VSENKRLLPLNYTLYAVNNEILFETKVSAYVPGTKGCIEVKAQLQ